MGKLIVLLLVAGTSVHASDQDCLAIEAAYAGNDLPTLLAIKPLSANGRSLRDFRLAAALLQRRDSKAAKHHIAAGLARARTEIDREPNNVEQLLFGAMFDGLHVLAHRWSFLINGIRGYRRLGKAELLDPGNPRATLVRGSAGIVMPRMLGGDPLVATALLEAAWQEAPPLCHDGHWGTTDILMWLGRGFDKLEQPDRATEYYARALALSPDNFWVQRALEGRGYRWER